VQAVAARANERFQKIADAQAIAFAPPPVLELGNASGFDLNCWTARNQGHDKLLQARDQLLDLARKDARLAQVRATGSTTSRNYQFNVDWERASVLGTDQSPTSITRCRRPGVAIRRRLIDRGRVKRVFIQGDARSRMLPQDLTIGNVRNSAGQNVPFSAFADAKMGTMDRPSWSAITECRRSKSSVSRLRVSAPAKRSMPWRAT